MQINIYYTLPDNVAKTICQLADKTYQNKLKAIIYTKNILLINQLDKLLWTYSSKIFLPHATNNDPYPNLQPIYITDTLENPNHSNILITANLTDIDTQQVLDIVEQRQNRRDDLQPNDVDKLKSTEYNTSWSKIFYIFDDKSVLKEQFLQISTILKQKLIKFEINLYTQTPEGGWLQQDINSLIA